MKDRELFVITGALTRSLRPRLTPPRDAMAKRWRMTAATSAEPVDRPDVVPLLDGWIRKLEREAGAEPVTRAR